MPNNEYVKREDIFPAVTEIAKEIVFGNQDDDKVVDIINSIPAADVEPKRKWVPVTERLPEEKISPMTMDYTEYPCVFDGRAGQREVRYYKFGKGHFWHGSGCIDEYVTHWAEPMLLPEPPKGEEDAEVH